MVRGNDEPGGMFGAALAQRGFERCGIGVPEWTFRVVPVADLPVTGGVVDARLEAFQLFFGVDVQIELEGMSAVVVEQFLEFVDGS